MVSEFLAENYSAEKQLFLIPKFVLYAIGFYPETKRTVWVLLWAAINFTLLIYGCYAELYYGIHYFSIDVKNSFDALCPVATSIMALYKIFFIWWYRVEIAALIDRVRVLSAADCMPSQLRIKRKFFTMATRLTALVLFFAACTSVAYSFRPIISNTLRYMNGEEWIYETPFKMMLPKILLSMPIYPITYVVVWWHGCITSAGFIGSDGIFLGFCLYFTALLQSLEEDLKVVLDTENAVAISNNIASTRANKHCEKLLTGIIDRYNEIFELKQKFSNVVIAITLGHFLSSSMIIGMSIVIILLFSGIAVYVVYACAVITQLFLYCYGGSIITEANQDVGTTVYCSQWYARSVPVQKMVMLFIERCQKPFVVKIPFFVPSLPTFVSIVRFAGSLIALAQQFL